MKNKITILQHIIMPFLPIYLFPGCSSHPTEPIQSLNDSYTISIAADGTIPISFSYTVHQGNRFILPFHYYDNPIDSINGELINNYTVVDAAGTTITTSSEDVTIGPIVNRIVIIPDNTSYPVTFSYQPDLSVLTRDSLSKDMPRIYRNKSSFYLQGSYFFIIPEISTDVRLLWRTRYTTDIEVINEAGTPVYGIPCDKFTCANIYELLFIQLSSTPRIVGQGHGGGIDFVFTDFFNKSYRPELSDSITGLLSLILDELTSIYGPFAETPQPCLPYTISLHPLWGALEGTYGFASREPNEGTDGRFGEILTHEALHHYIGIKCGEYDDPWWKEAAATYLGLETAVKLGMYGKEAFRERITSRFFWADSARFQKSLSDPWLRDYMFTDQIHTIAYDRGSQVMMLLDVRTRAGSGNRYTLHHVMADLCRQFSGSAFRRHDFTAALSTYGAGNTEDIFATYVDRPDSVLSAEQLKEIFMSLDSLAAW
jgi:hypothetical protein